MSSHITPLEEKMMRQSWLFPVEILTPRSRRDGNLYEQKLVFTSKSEYAKASSWLEFLPSNYFLVHYILSFFQLEQRNRHERPRKFQKNAHCVYRVPCLQISCCYKWSQFSSQEIFYLSLAPVVCGILCVWNFYPDVLISWMELFFN